MKRLFGIGSVLLSLFLLFSLVGCYTTLVVREREISYESLSDSSAYDSTQAVVVENNYFYDDYWSPRIGFWFYHPSVYWHDWSWYSHWPGYSYWYYDYNWYYPYNWYGYPWYGYRWHGYYGNYWHHWDNQNFSTDQTRPRTPRTFGNTRGDILRNPSRGETGTLPPKKIDRQAPSRPPGTTRTYTPPRQKSGERSGTIRTPRTAPQRPSVTPRQNPPSRNTPPSRDTGRTGRTRDRR